MQLAGQDTPDTVQIPDRATCRLRAKLILEEAFETVTALGIRLEHNGKNLAFDQIDFVDGGEVDLEGVVDGCADISVVTIGTLVAFGVEDVPVLEEVDRANLRKFGPGSYAREDGKWMKPPDWVPPDVLGVLQAPENPS